MDESLRTSVMLRNIPNKYTQRMLLSVVHELGFNQTCGRWLSCVAVVAAHFRFLFNIFRVILRLTSVFARIEEL